MSDELGVYEDEIIEIIDSVNAEQEKGREALNYLALKIDHQADEVSELLALGL